MASAAHALQELKRKYSAPKMNRKGMGLAHFQRHELKQMDFAQGGESIDPETKYPEYSRLGEIFKSERVRRFFLNLKGQLEENGEIDPALKKLAAHIRKKVPAFIETKSPLKEEEAYKKAGIRGDTEIALVPFSLLKFFDEIRGKPQTNPKTGLPMYGFFEKTRSRFKVVDPRLEAAKMDHVRNQLRQQAEAHDDDNSGDILGNLVNVGFTLLGSAIGGPAGGSIGSSVGKAITGSDTGKIRHSQASRRAEEEDEEENTFTPARVLKKKKDDSEDNDWSWGSIAKHALPPALTIAGAFATAHGERKEKAEAERRYKRDKEEQERRLKNSGYHSQLRSHFASYDDLYPKDRDVSIPKAVEYKTGGVVQGKPIQGSGNGQSDSINVDSTREGEWIWDASTVADLGDGSTDAGWREILKLERLIKKRPGFKSMHEFKPGVAPRKVKTALSNGEFRTPTKIVTALGNGDNAKGAAILRRMTQNIRLYKNSNGNQLPPSIKDPRRFLEQATHQEMRHA